MSEIQVSGPFRYATYVGVADLQPAPYSEYVEYMMLFFPIPVLRKPTKRGRLRYQGKLRAREHIRRLYEGE